MCVFRTETQTVTLVCLEMINDCVSVRCWVTNDVCFASEHGKRQNVEELDDSRRYVLVGYVCCEIYLGFDLWTDKLIAKEIRFVDVLFHTFSLMQYRGQAGDECATITHIFHAWTFHLNIKSNLKAHSFISY